MSGRTKWAVGAICTGALLSLPTPALAVFPGVNGEIAFVSGRPNSDASSDVYVIAGPNGAFTQNPLTTAAGQHRLPNWSPNGTKIAYALQNAGTADDIFIHKIGSATPVNLTNSPTITEDRPTWSPDGTKIAYESEVGTQIDVLIRNLKAPLGPNPDLAPK